jgi:hypothetical protein
MMQKKQIKRTESIERFKRVASFRTDKVLGAIRSLGKCANRKSYEYDKAQVEKIFRAINREIKICRAQYDSESMTAANKFKL